MPPPIFVELATPLCVTLISDDVFNEEEHQPSVDAFSTQDSNSGCSWTKKLKQLISIASEAPDFRHRNTVSCYKDIIKIII
jgi:hypothetical protein